MKLKIACLFLLLLAQLPVNSVAQSTQVRPAPVQVGDEAPDFMLEDQQGRKVTLSKARGKQPVVLVFYRGYW